MELRIVSVGDVSSGTYGRLINEYLERAERYISVSQMEVDKASNANKSAAKKREADNLRDVWREREHRVAVDRKGSSVSSREFAERLNRWMVGSPSVVSFFIGGAEGLDSDFKRECDERISLSKLTFPHKLAAVVMAEQIYRALTIIRGRTYHK